MDNSEVFDSIVNYLIENDYCADEEGAYGIIENSSEAMIQHLAELAPLAAIPAIAGKAAAVAGKAGKVASTVSKGVSAAKGVGKAANKVGSAISPHDGGGEPSTSKVEALEVVCDYLLDEGYAETGAEAENIFDHMSEEWMNHILENRFAAHAGKDTDAGAAMAKQTKGGNKKGVYVMKGKDGKPLFDKRGR